MESNQNIKAEEAALVNEFLPLVTAWLKKWYN
jgi:hypothetical protein